MGSLKEQFLKSIGTNEEIITQKTKPSKSKTELRLQKAEPQKLTAEQEDFILEQAREDYLNKKYGVED